MYRRIFVIIASIFILGCKNSSSQKKEVKSVFSHMELIGKKFYYYDEKNKVVEDDNLTKGSDLRFFKDRILEINFDENKNYKISSYSYDNGILTYDVSPYPNLSIKYDKSEGFLHVIDKNNTLKYIDSIRLFDKDSKIKYNYKSINPYGKEIKTSYSNFKKNRQNNSNDNLLPIDKWIGDNTIIDNISGDLNNDGIEDRVYCVVPKGKKEETSDIETIVLFGSDKENLFRLYNKSKKNIPCQFCEFDYLSTTESIYVIDFDDGKLILTSSVDGEVNGLYSFTFEYKSNDLILTNFSKEISTGEENFEQKMNLPNFNVSLKDFDVYYFIKKAQSDRY